MFHYSLILEASHYRSKPFVFLFYTSLSSLSTCYYFLSLQIFGHFCKYPFRSHYLNFRKLLTLTKWNAVFLSSHCSSGNLLTVLFWTEIMSLQERHWHFPDQDSFNNSLSPDIPMLLNWKIRTFSDRFITNSSLDWIIYYFVPFSKERKSVPGLSMGICIFNIFTVHALKINIYSSEK